MKKILSWMVVGGGITAIVVGCGLLPAASTGTGNEYTVRGNQSDYQRRDSRVYINAPKTEALVDDGIHDPNNDALAALQDPGVALKSLPYDRRGGVNWVKAIDQGLINPRADLTGEGEMKVMDLDIYFTNTGQMPHVRFPHLAHTRWLDCSNCHPKIFTPQRGSNKIGMDAILAGEFCGRCHDKVAFPLWTCERCHSVPHEKSPAVWWRKQDNPDPVSSNLAPKLPETADLPPY
ncbi:MAG: hypothetical protein OEW08_01110 [Gammaproteobacteria bacterium]|nr:hypothetical protein [Gammaproteobacteria bacterium]